MASYGAKIADKTPTLTDWLVERPEGQGGDVGRFEEINGVSNMQITDGALLFYGEDGKLIVAYNANAWLTVVPQ